MKKLVALYLLFFFLFSNTAFAAISFVGSCEHTLDTTPNGDDLTFTIPATEVNDLVIVAYAIGDNDGVNENMAMVSPAATFTEVSDLFADDTQDINLGVYWDITDDSYTQVVVDGLGGTDAAVAAVCMVFRGVDTSTPMDETAVGGSTLNTMHANPGAINHNNPSGVWTVIAGASGHTLAAAGTYTFPTGYTTNALESGADDTSDATVGLGYRSSGVSDPEDPGTMTHSGSDSTNFASATTTMALRPAIATAPSISCSAADGVTVFQAGLHGDITATGGDTPTVRGFAWGTSSTLSNGGVSTTTESGSFSTGAFSHTISTLLANKQYFFRGYATNAVGTAYCSSILNFTLSADPGTISRKMHLFYGTSMRLIDGRIIIHKQ